MTLHQPLKHSSLQRCTIKLDMWPFIFAILLMAGLYVSSNEFGEPLSRYFSTKKEAAQNPFPCTGTVYLVFKDINAVIKEKIVALGKTSDILSYGSIRAINAEKFTMPGEDIKLHGLQSAKGRFIYEIPEASVRLSLYKLGLVETIILPSNAFERFLRDEPGLNYLAIRLVANADTEVDKDHFHDKYGSRRTRFTVKSAFALDYIRKNFSKLDNQNLECK